MTAACATIVARDDPHLHATALFAPDPTRARLMALYAFDIELSRATLASAEAMIPRMRLQWWRDVIEGARKGAPPPRHEVAGPLAGMIGAGVVDPADLDALVEAREMELDLHFDEARYLAWHGFRFQCLVRAASAALTHPAPAAGPPAPPQVSGALSAAFVLRHAASRAARGEPAMVPGIEGPDLAALARGTLTETCRDRFRALAEEGLEELRRARARRRDQDPRIAPALLPLARAERTLRLVRRDPAAVLGRIDSVDRPFDGLRLAWRALSGRW